MVEHKRILVVDDDANVLLVMRATLENLGSGTKVVAASNGQEAIAPLQNAHGSVVERASRVLPNPYGGVRLQPG